MREDKVVTMHRRDVLDRERLGPLGRGVRLILAALAIGQVFILPGPIALWQALAVAVGAFLAVEAFVGWGPVAAWHAAQREWLRERRRERSPVSTAVSQAEEPAAKEAKDLPRAA